MGAAGRQDTMFKVTRLINSEGRIGTQGVGFSPAWYVKQTNQACVIGNEGVALPLRGVPGRVAP